MGSIKDRGRKDKLVNDRKSEWQKRASRLSIPEPCVLLRWSKYGKEPGTLYTGINHSLLVWPWTVI